MNVDLKAKAEELKKELLKVKDSPHLLTDIAEFFEDIAGHADQMLQEVTEEVEKGGH